MKYEIESLPGADEGNQQLVVDLSNVPFKNFHYKDAQKKIKEITSAKGYKEPVRILVRNTAEHDISVDGKLIKASGTVEAGDKSVKALDTAMVYPWQLRALRRWLTPVEPDSAK